MAFDAPRGRERFLPWHRQATTWSEGHDSEDPAATTADLRAWYEDIRKLVRNVDGPDVPTDNELDTPGLDTPGVEDRLAGYTMGHHAIYADFRWTVADEACDAVRHLAAHGAALRRTSRT